MFLICENLRNLRITGFLFLRVLRVLRGSTPDRAELPGDGRIDTVARVTPRDHTKLDQPGTFESLGQEVFLRVLKAADVLEGELAHLLKGSGLSPTQYNVLRILRSAGRAGMPCGRITDRMIAREPDMTRLLDRLEARGLIKRDRSPRDRRVVLGRITPAGGRLLKSLDKPVLGLHARQLGHLGPTRLRRLAGLLAAARART